MLWMKVTGVCKIQMLHLILQYLYKAYWIWQNNITVPVGVTSAKTENEPQQFINLQMTASGFDMSLLVGKIKILTILIKDTKFMLITK